MINYSPSESKILDIKIGRAHLDTIDTGLLTKDIIAQQFDCCMLKVPANLPDLFIQLDKLQLPYYVSGVVSKYHIDFVKHTAKGFLHENLSFEIFDGTTNRELLEEIVRASFQNEPLTYYDIPFFKKNIARKQELDCLVNYVLSFDNIEKFDAESVRNVKMNWLVKFDATYIGFVSVAINGKSIEYVLAGILPSYQGRRIYLDMLRYMQNYALSLGMEDGYLGSRIQNIPAQKVYHKGNMTVQTYYLNIHLLPFLSKSLQQPIYFVYDEEQFYLPNFTVKIQQVLANKKQAVHLSKWSGINKVQVKVMEKQKKINKSSVKLSFPIVNQEELVIVATILKENIRPIIIAYLFIQRTMWH